MVTVVYARLKGKTEEESKALINKAFGEITMRNLNNDPEYQNLSVRLRKLTEPYNDEHEETPVRSTCPHCGGVSMG